jgi:hypothetical protein
MPLDYIEFSKKIKTKYPEYSDVDDLTLARKMVEKYPEYKNEVTFGDEPVKKKEVSQSIFDQGGFSSAMSKMAQNQPSVSSVEKPKKKKEEIFTGYPGQEDKKYKLDSDKGFPVWKEYSSTDYDKKTGKQVDKFEEQITNPSRVAELNRHFNVDASTDAIEQVYTNYSEDKKDNEYRVTDNKWQRKVPGATEWTNIINEGSISALNTRYNKNVKFNPEAEYVKPEPKLKFNDVNTSLVGKTEEAAQKVLTDKYGKYGFTFEQDGYFTDYITVSNKDETKKITVGFDEKNPEEALKLRTFLEQNASKPKSVTATTLENKIKDFNSQKYYSGKGGMEMGENKDLLKYIKSDEYAEQLKSLTYDEVKDQFEEFVKPSFSKKSDLDEIYKSKAYGVYKNKKKAEFAGRNSKVDALYTELRSVSGNYKKEKEVKAKINAYLTDDVIQDQVKDYSMQLNDLNNAAKKLEKEKKAYTQLVSDFNGRVPSMSQEEYNAAKKDLEDKAESIGTKADSLMIAGKSIQKDQKKLNIIAGEYVTEKSKAGSFGGGLVNSFLNGVSKTFLEVPYELVNSVAFSSDYFRLSPEEKKFYKDKGYSEDQVTNLLKNKNLKEFKSSTREAIINVAGADQTTEEYMKSEDRGFFEKALYGVAESAPAMLLGFGGGTASFAGLAAQSYSSIVDEMLADPDFETSSAGERAVIAVPYSILMGVLENYGLKNAVKGESFTGGLMKNIMVKVADKMPANATREALEALYNKEIKSLIGKGVFKIVNGAVAEFETGATQALVLDIGLKSVYNKMIQSGMTEEEISNLSGGELFSTPDTFGGVASTVLEDGLAEAIGGATISTFSTVASGLINGNISLYNEKDLDFLKEMSDDKGFKGLIVANLKSEMLKGNITKSEAQEKLQAMNELESTINSVPENLSKKDQINAVNMIAERNRLTRETQGKDPALVAAQTERINEINNRLKTISENAVQVETTSEVSVQPEARVGEEVVQGESKTEPQSITEEGQEVEVLRAKEQEEIRAKFPDAEYKADGKIDADKLSVKDRKAFDKIYAKYDKLITPLLEAEKISQDNRTVSDQDNLITQDNFEEQRSKQTTAMGQRIVTAAKLVMKALPGIKIYLHNNNSEYESGIKAISEKGEYGSYLNGEIHLNIEGANVVTLLHEAMHHALVVKGIKSGTMLDLVRGLKSVISDKGLKQRLEKFISQYKEEEDRAEEYAAELGAIMAEAKKELTITKFQQFKNLINRIAKKLGLPVIFSASSNAKDAVDFMNSLTKAIRTGENIEPYTSVESATVIKDAPLKVRKKRISEYTADFIAKIPTKTLKEAISKYEGKIFFIQSDATGVGYDSKGDPIYGGLGYITIKENVDGSIGFASIDDGTAKISISKMINRYGEGEKVGVFVMIQNPSSTVGNYYGAKYFGRALIELQKKSKTNYRDIANSFVDYIKSNSKIVDELNKNKTQQKLIDLIKNPEKYNEKIFADEFIKDTTFEVRRNILESLIPITSDVKTNKSTPYIKQSLKDIGFNRLEFLKEYGDNTLFTEDMYLGNEGNFLAAGFEIELPKKEELDNFILKYKNNGIKHPQFNGKLPNTGESFLLDGLYPVNENFVEFAKDETIIDKDVLSDEELKKVVQEKFPNDSFYEDKFTSINSNKYIPRENRTYAHLKTPNKIIFKSSLEKTNPKALKSKPSNVSTNVARGMGFSPEVGEKQKQLMQKTEFTKRETQAKRKKQISDDKDIAIQKAKEKYDLSVEERGNSHQQGVESALNDLRKSDWYNNADDIQRENAERELKVFFGERLKAAPATAKILGKPKAKSINVKDEMAALKDQIRLEARAARQAKADLNAKRKMLSAAVSKMVKLGTVKARQAAFLIKRISYLNLDNPVMVDRFANYAEKIFERADYQNVLTNAFALRKGIRRLLKTDNQAQVVGMARAFAKIDPSMVDDIDAYIEMANTVKAAVKPTVQKGFDTVMKEAASISKVSEYTNRVLAEQEEMQRKEFLAQYNDVDGMSENMTLAEMKEFISSLEDPNSKSNPNKEADTILFLKERMSNAVDVIEEVIRSGFNPMTGEQVGDENKDIMSKVIKIDLDEMSIRDAIKIVEGLENFIENSITSGLEAAVNSYQGNLNAKSLVARGKTARPLRLFISKTVGKIYSEQLFSLPNLMEKMFGGVTNSIQIMKDMGLMNLIIGVNKANRQHNDIIENYSKQSFYKSKGFMDAANVYERGMIGFLKRNLMGTPQQMKAEFDRRVRMIQESINKLVEEGDSKEKKMGEIYQKVYDKLGVGEGDLDVILSKASDTNLEAVDWWINNWSEHYQDLSDVSLSVYNTELGSDFNYTTDKYKKLSSEDQGLDEGVVSRNGAFAVEIDYTDKKKTGVLMESTRPNVLPNGRYVSLDFDTNNSNSLKAALVDINTAASIRQVDGFINSKAFKKLVPESADRKILTKRINSYIRRAKGKNIVPRDTIEYINKFTNYITSLGVGKALAGLNQTFMQTMPVMINTLANAGRFDIAGPDFNEWLNKTGMPITNRGLESQSAIDSVDRRLEATGQRTQDVLNKIADINQFYLKWLLSKPDVWVARSSFKSYYLQGLKRKGISTNIDWATHEMDQEVAEYAQIMVDRQQNISDPMLAGEFLASDNPYIKITRKVILPFASFILNQKARMYNDFLTAFRTTTSNEDRIIAMKSLFGLTAELATYQSLGYGIKLMYDLGAAWLLGDDDEEEKVKKFLGLNITKRQYNATKLPIKSIFNDIVSPLPMLDWLTTMGLNKTFENLEYMTEQEIKDAVKERNRILEIKGDDPMDKDAEKEFIDNIKKEATYQVFDNDFDRSYGMIGIAGSTYKELAEIGKLTYTGEFIDDYQGRETKKKLLPADKDKLEAALLPMILYSTGILPKDVGTISRKYIDRVKKKAVTEKQYERFDEVQKELNRDLKSWEIDIVKDKKEVNTAVDELNFVKNNGGLTESQGREYVKLMDQIGAPSVSDLRRIQNGEKASQILK